MLSTVLQTCTKLDFQSCSLLLLQSELEEAERMKRPSSENAPTSQARLRVDVVYAPSATVAPVRCTVFPYETSFDSAP